MANPMELEVLVNVDWYSAPGEMVTLPVEKLPQVVDLINKSQAVLKAGANSVSWSFKPVFTWYWEWEGELEKIDDLQEDMEFFSELVVYPGGHDYDHVVIKFSAEDGGECEVRLPYEWTHRVTKGMHILDECPECGDTELWADYFDNDETSAWREVQCQCCFHKWNEVYDFSHNEPR